MMNVVKLSGIMMNVVKLSVIVLNVVGACCRGTINDSSNNA
jgi:hypothetical protein